MTIAAWAGEAALLAAEQEPKGPEFGKASPLGLLVIIVLLIGVFLLIRSMNRQLKKLPESFDADHPEADQAFDEGTEPSAADETAADETGDVADSGGHDATDPETGGARDGEAPPA